MGLPQELIEQGAAVDELFTKARDAGHKADDDNAAASEALKTAKTSADTATSAQAEATSALDAFVAAIRDYYMAGPTPPPTPPPQPQRPGTRPVPGPTGRR